MNRIIITLLLIFLGQHCVAQSGTWTWMHGSTTSGGSGNYGTQGVAAATNEPPARYQAAYWTDLDGNFWVFGGVGTSSNMNDLWKWDISNSTWTWMHGPQLGTNIAGNYGTQGVSSPLNIPPARGFGANCWTGTDGHLYLFGGFMTAGSGNDLWRYEINTNEWTWIDGAGGSTLAVYGTKGVANANNDPGARQEIKSGWVIGDELWMFGGNTNNDTWRYELSTNQWTWMAGTQVGGSTGSYGTKGVEDPSNVPPGRWSYTKWKDKNDKLYIFSGADGIRNYNDMWSYNLLNNQWTWIGGPNQPDDQGTNNPTHCQEDESYIPASRMENQTAQINSDCATAFWTFGGMRNWGFNCFNDLWIYNTAKNAWTLVWGQNTPNNNPAVPGTMGVSSPSNYIQARGGVCIWTDNDQNLWVYGGVDNNAQYLGDLWKFTPDSSCFDIVAANSSFQWPDPVTICAGDTSTVQFPANTLITVTPAGQSTYDANTGELKLFPGFTQDFTVQAKTPPSNPCPIDETETIKINVNHKPVADFILTPSIVFISDPRFKSLNKSIDADTYRWTYEGNLITTDENFQMSFSEIGKYCFTLEATNQCGMDQVTRCGEVAPTVAVPNAFTPNGDDNNDVFRLVNPGELEVNYLRVFNRWGEQVFFTDDKYQAWDGRLRGEECPTGTYFYVISIRAGNEDIPFRGDVTLIR